MTELTEHDASPASAAQLDRVAQIRARRDAACGTATTAAMPLVTPQVNPPAEPTVKAQRRRRHSAQGSRIVAAGLGAAGMLGIVTMFGLDSAATVADAQPPAQPPAQPVTLVAAPQPVQVVIHRIPATTDPTAPVLDAAGVDPAVVADVVAPQPVQLTANPVVRTVTEAGNSQPRSSGSSAPAAQVAPAPAPAATTSGSG